MLRENDDLEGALKSYILLFKEEKYFEAHEALEEAWHPLRKSDHALKNLVKGIINAAISFEHLKRGGKDAVRKSKQVMTSYDRHKGIAISSVEHAELFYEVCEMIDFQKRKILVNPFE